MQNALVEVVALYRCWLGTVVVEGLPHVLEVRRVKLLLLCLIGHTYGFLVTSRLLTGTLWPCARCCSEAEHVPGLRLIDLRTIYTFLYTQEIGVLNVATAIVSKSPCQLVVLAEGLLRTPKWVAGPNCYQALHQGL